MFLELGKNRILIPGHQMALVDVLTEISLTKLGHLQTFLSSARSNHSLMILDLGKNRILIPGHQMALVDVLIEISLTKLGHLETFLSSARSKSLINVP